MSDCPECIHDDERIAYWSDEQIDHSRRNLARRAAIALGLGGIVALFTGRKPVEAAWQVGWCLRTYCYSPCRTRTDRRPRMRNEYGAEWCEGTWQFVAYTNYNCCAHFGQPGTCCR